MSAPRILCIDNHSNNHAPFTQTYLSLLRSWTANTTPQKNWLFKSAHSAGLLLQTPFSTSNSTLFPGPLTPPSQTRTNASLHAFNAQKTFESTEKREILALVANRRIRGLHARDFADFEYVLCFDARTAEALRLLKGVAKMQGLGNAAIANIFVLDIRRGFWESEEGLGSAKRVVREWAGRHLGFVDPGREIVDGFWRTRLVVITEAGSRALARDGDRRLGELRGKTGCVFRFGGLDDGGWVVSVTGERGRVEEAARGVLETW